MHPIPMSRSALGATLKRLTPDPVSSPTTRSRATVVTTFTICETATAAATAPSDTPWRRRYRPFTATWPTVGGMAIPTNALESCTKKPRTIERRFGTNAARLSAAPR